MRPLQRRALLLAPLALVGAPAATLERRTLTFPRDHGSHPDTRAEWWYLTGWLQDTGAPATARPLAGFQLTFFRSRTGLGEGHPSAFAARQLLFAHAALTLLNGEPLRHDQRTARAGLGLAEAATGDTALVIDAGPRAWVLQRDEVAGHSRYTAGWHNADTALALTAQATQPLLLQGDAGWSRKGPSPNQASQYVTEPQLEVTGQLQQAGQRRAVQGRAWLDHEWSDDLLAPGVQGWDWIGINLFNGDTLTAFQLRDATGQATWAGGSHRPAGAAARAFTPAEVRFQASGPRWTSPTTGATYPVGWQVHTVAGRWTVRPLQQAQELDTRRSTGTAYWEGLCELLDGRGQAVGRGYLEMTGYAGALRLAG